MSTNHDSLEAVELEVKREMAKKFLVSLRNVDSKVFSSLPAVLRKRDNIDAFHSMMYILRAGNAKDLSEMSGLLKYLSGSHTTSDRVLHDLNNFAQMIAPVIFNVHPDADQELTTPEQVETAVFAWDRVKVSLEDMLLRVLDAKKIPEDNIRPVNVKVWENVINFFSTKELAKIKSGSNDNNSPYKGSANRDVEVDVDWQAIQTALNHKKVMANDGVVCNFILNALRNALKDRIQADNGGPTKVNLSIKIENDELVVRIEDSGKGMTQDHLSDDKPELSIFTPGVSGTGSTGLGLANFNTRFASCGGALYVVSRREGDTSGKSATYQMGGTEEGQHKVMFDHPDHGTVFELRLKIENK